MKHRELTAGAAGLSITAAVAIGAVGAAGATSAVPSSVIVKQAYSVKMVPNHYILDGMRFDRDLYTVASGGTVQFRMTAPQEGPHTFTVVASKDLPKTANEAFNCKVCDKLAKAHGADPNSHAPPKFQFLENGVGQHTPPHLDRPGDSGFLPPQRGSTTTFKVTAPKGTTLKFMCLIHGWMQATLEVR
jgi:plastocyanin